MKPTVPPELKTNAYRVLRLSAKATLSDVHKAASARKRAAVLGMNSTEEELPILGDASCGNVDIRMAVGRLGNPAERIHDRLFWFYNLPIRNDSDEPPDIHDRALHKLITALEAALEDAGVAVWTQALRTWHESVSNDDYWSFNLAIENAGSFEPVALPAEVEALRSHAVQMAAAPLISAARDAVAREDIATTRRIMKALRELADTGGWATAAQQDIASPLVTRVQTLCQAVKEEFDSKILRKDDNGAANKTTCESGITRFRNEVEPTLNQVLQLVDRDHLSARQSREEAALLLSAIGVGYTWADDYVTSAQLQEEALKMATNTLSAIGIETALEYSREQVRKQRFWGEPVYSAPSLATIESSNRLVYGALLGSCGICSVFTPQFGHLNSLQLPESVEKLF